MTDFDVSSSSMNKDDNDEEDKVFRDHPMMKPIDDSFRCKICQDHFKAAVLIKCGHSFCSECIRTSFRTSLTGLKRQASCPLCRQTFPARNIESLLTPNRALQESVKEWKVYLQKQMSLSSSTSSSSTTTKEATTTTTSSRPKRTRKTSESTNEETTESKVVQDQSSLSNHSDNHASCSKKPPPNFTGMKRKRLVELCKKEGLPTTTTTMGTDHEQLQQLKDRYQAFITLWNSEMDSVTPRPKDQIIQEVLERERARAAEKKREIANGLTMHAKCMEKVKDSRKRLGEEQQQQQQEKGSNGMVKVSSGNPEFDRQLKQGFSNLIQQYKRQRNNKPYSSADVPNETTNAQLEEEEVRSPGTTASTASGFYQTAPSSSQGHSNSRKEAQVTNVSPSPAPQSDQMPKPSKDESLKEVNKTKNEETTNNNNSSSSVAVVQQQPPPPKKTNNKKVQTRLVPKKKHNIGSKRPANDDKDNATVIEIDLCSHNTRSHKMPKVLPWDCARCTFINKSTITKMMICEMCGFSQSGSNASSSSSSSRVIH